jgi:hypothetical protein
MTRRRLPDRRVCLTISFEHEGILYTASYGLFEDGTPGELFLNTSKGSNGLNTSVRDAAIATSFALQSGTDLDVLRKALSRNSNGTAAGALGAALDLLAAESVLDQPTAADEVVPR